MELKYNLGIIGAGPAGYTAALHAAANGLSVIMFEKDKTGGVCLNKGCIPTKSIMHAAEIYEDLKCMQDFGINAGNITLDYKKIIEHKNEIVEKLRKSLELTIKNSGITTVNSEAKIIDKNHIQADKVVYELEKIIYAGGSTPRALKGINFDGNFILSSDDILKRETLPSNILIAGSGAIGTEWARIFAAFDTEVTVVEAAENLLPAADIEVSKRLERIFKAKKIKYYTNNSVAKISDKKVYLSGGEIIEPECVLVAAGRIPNHPQNIEGVTYLGDAAGEIQLAHFAVKQAVNEISNIKFDKTLVPSVVYGNPEIAWVGKREQDLGKGSYEKANILVSALGKAHCDNSTDGFIKILSRNKKIIGAHIVAKEASSLIQQIVIAMQNDITTEKLKEVCFAHPTYSEGIFECLFRLKAVN